MTGLTGRTRYCNVKVGLFGPTVLVLEVEESTHVGPPDWDGLPCWHAGTYWRKATIEDLSTAVRPIEGMIKLKEK